MSTVVGFPLRVRPFLRSNRDGTWVYSGFNHDYIEYLKYSILFFDKILPEEDLFLGFRSSYYRDKWNLNDEEYNEFSSVIEYLSNEKRLIAPEDFGSYFSEQINDFVYDDSIKDKAVDAFYSEDIVNILDNDSRQKEDRLARVALADSRRLQKLVESQGLDIAIEGVSLGEQTEASIRAHAQSVSIIMRMLPIFPRDVPLQEVIDLSSEAEFDFALKDSIQCIKEAAYLPQREREERIEHIYNGMEHVLGRIAKKQERGIFKLAFYLGLDFLGDFFPVTKKGISVSKGSFELAASDAAALPTGSANLALIHSTLVDF